MGLSNTKLKEEIEGVKEAIKKLLETKQKCEDGVLINQIVLEAFENKLLKE